jgi:hypothetical protein
MIPRYALGDDLSYIDFVGDEGGGARAVRVRPVLDKATLMIRDMTIELGTLEVPLKRIVRPTRTIRSRIG